MSWQYRDALAVEVNLCVICAFLEGGARLSQEFHKSFALHATSLLKTCLSEILYSVKKIYIISDIFFFKKVRVPTQQKKAAPKDCRRLCEKIVANLRLGRLFLPVPKWMPVLLLGRSLRLLWVRRHLRHSLVEKHRP